MIRSVGKVRRQFVFWLRRSGKRLAAAAKRSASAARASRPSLWRLFLAIDEAGSGGMHILLSAIPVPSEEQLLNLVRGHGFTKEKALHFGAAFRCYGV